MNHLIMETTDQGFDEQVLHSELPILIEFTADWCPPCKMLAPIVKEIARKYEGKLRVGMLDSDANPKVIEQYDVMGLPTLILFVNGVAVETIIGFTPRERIEAKLLPHLVMQDA